MNKYRTNNIWVFSTTILKPVKVDYQYDKDNKNIETKCKCGGFGCSY